MKLKTIERKVRARILASNNRYTPTLRDYMLHEFFMKLEAIKSDGFYQSKGREDDGVLMFMRECRLVRRITEKEYNPSFIGMPHMQVYLATPESDEFYDEVLESRPQLASRLSLANRQSQ